MCNACTDLLQCTHEPNVSVPQMAGLLIERTQDTQWVVVYKALISTHTIMNYGNEVSGVVTWARTRQSPRAALVKTTAH